MFPVAWFFQLVVHEASHLVVGWWDEGRRPTGFWPYPHRHDGRWFFARCSMGPAVPGRWDPTWRHLSRHIAPMYWGLVLAALAGAVTLTTWWALPWVVCGLGDVVWWWRGYFWGSPRSDGKRWRYGDAHPG